MFKVDMSGLEKDKGCYVIPEGFRFHELIVVKELDRWGKNKVRTLSRNLARLIL